MPARPFILRLQSVRGLAALTVAAAHAVEALKFPHERQYEQRIALNVAYGEGAVIVFFILSGFVLSLTMDRKSTWGLAECWHFIKKRLLRLYPAVFFCSLIYLLVGYLVRFPDHPSALLNHFGQPSFSAADLIQNFLLLKTTLIGVAWSLQPELLFSLLLPISYLWTSRSSSAHFIILGLFLAAFYIFPLDSPFHSTYLFIFYAGSITYFFRSHLASAYSRIPKPVIYLLYLVCAGIGFSALHFGHHLDLLTVAATFVIGCVALDITPLVFKFLDAKALVALGNISYSFYLLHPVCLGVCTLAVVSLLPDSLMLAHIWLVIFILWTISTAVTIPVSALSFHISERPFTSTGKRSKVQAIKAI
jgi:peptidoglycan/LPS O-acetylase OafA/YrhL